MLLIGHVFLQGSYVSYTRPIEVFDGIVDYFGFVFSAGEIINISKVRGLKTK